MTNFGVDFGAQKGPQDGPQRTPKQTPNQSNIDTKNQDEKKSLLEPSWGDLGRSEPVSKTDKNTHMTKLRLPTGKCLSGALGADPLDVFNGISKKL